MGVDQFLNPGIFVGQIGCGKVGNEAFADALLFCIMGDAYCDAFLGGETVKVVGVFFLGFIDVNSCLT